MKKKAVFTAATTATAMILATGITSLAAGWQQNAKGYWYGTNADNTTWYSNGWQWIDGNGDGVAECYYFDGNGYMLANTTTPDGYQVNASGAWVQNGHIQTKNTTNSSSNSEYSNISGKFSIDMSNGKNVVRADGDTLIVDADYSVFNNGDLVSSNHLNGKFKLLDSTVYYGAEDAGDYTMSKSEFFRNNNMAMGPGVDLKIVNGIVISIGASA